jgi:hypothetical protein
MDEFSLTAKQRRQLELVLHQTCDARLYRRVLAILEVSRGISVEEVAQTLGRAITTGSSGSIRKSARCP